MPQLAKPIMMLVPGVCGLAAGIAMVLSCDGAHENANASDTPANTLQCACECPDTTHTISPRDDPDQWEIAYKNVSEDSSDPLLPGPIFLTDVRLLRRLFETKAYIWVSTTDECGSQPFESFLISDTEKDGYIPFSGSIAVPADQYLCISVHEANDEEAIVVWSGYRPYDSTE